MNQFSKIYKEIYCKKNQQFKQKLTPYKINERIT